LVPDSKRQIQIIVSDTGIGIKEKDMEKLFSKFTKIDLGEKITANSTGVGLGLSIANNLAVRLGPQGSEGIQVSSKYGEGSMFKFIIENKDERNLP